MRHQAIIVDMDGTLADVRPIRHYVTGDPKDRRFDLFHWESVNVDPNLDVVHRVRQLHAEGIKVIIVTAREAKWRNHTAWFLAMHDIPSDMLFMRANGDYRADTIVKADILAAIRCNFDVVHAFDDNPSVIALWESEGIPVTVVEGFGFDD